MSEREALDPFRAPFGPALRRRIEAHLAAFEPRSLEEHAASVERLSGIEPDALRPAAVAVTLLAGADDRGAFVLTRRAALRHHGGQYALPGGRLDPGEDAVDAALRELAEEVGLEASREAVLGRLDDYPTRSGFRITPVVVWVDGPAQLVLDPREVAAADRVPLADLDAPEVPTRTPSVDPGREVLSVPLGHTVVFSPTAAILYQLAEVGLRGRSTRVVEVDQPVFAWK